MTLDDARTTYAWHSALDLAPHLVRLAEQLPDDESAGLGSQLRILAADVPASVAADLVTGSATAATVALRALATLEVVERVYPALDTLAGRSVAEGLVDRITGSSFSEQEAGPAAEAADASVDEPEPTPPLPMPADISAAIADVSQLAPVSEPAPAHASPAAFGVPVTAAPTTVPVATETAHVQPDSPQ